MSESQSYNGSDSDPTTESHVRTNVRTEKVLAEVDRVTAVDAGRAHTTDSRIESPGQGLARAALAQARANACKHGVRPDRCHDCAAIRTTEEGK